MSKCKPESKCQYDCPSCGEHVGGQFLCRDCLIETHQEKINELQKIFREPVMPVSKYCESLTTWADCIMQGIEDNPDDTNRQGNSYVEHLRHIIMDIHKSGLLARLIYCGDVKRTEKCPVHTGKMSTGLWVAGGDVCCDGSGWLEVDIEVRRKREDAVRAYYKKHPDLRPLS